MQIHVLRRVVRPLIRSGLLALGVPVALAATLGSCGGAAGDDATCDLLPGDLVISELMVNVTGTDDKREWIELYNASPKAQSLNRIDLSIAGSGEPKTDTLRDAGTLEPGGYFVIGDGTAAEAPVDYSYKSTLSLADSGGVIGISCKGKLIDEVRYGERGGAPQPSEGISLSFDGGVAPDALVNDDGAAWCARGDTYDGTNIGTPGERNVVCGITSCMAGGSAREVRLPRAGELVISEVFGNPSGADAGKEWIELYVAAPGIDLNGLTIVHTNTSGTSTAPRSVTLASEQCLAVEAGSYVVIAAAADPAVNGGITADAVASDLDLFNSTSSTLELRRSSLVIDMVTLPSLGTEGQALTLDASISSADANDDPASYCKTPGSPGEPNASCGGITPVTSTCNDAGTTRAIVSPAAGDLVITEAFSAATGTDAGKEWVEIYVAASGDVDLNGLSLRNTRSNTRSFNLGGADCVRVSAGSYVVIGASSDAAVNGGVPVDVVVAGLAIYDDASTLALVRPDMVLVDEAQLPDAADGVAVQLAAGALTANANDLASSFCAATSSGSFGKGTPGEANSECAAVTPGDQCQGTSGPRAMVAPQVGDLVVTEVFSAATGTDAGKEWFEVYVAASSAVDLNGLVVRDIRTTTRSVTLTSSACLQVDPGTYIVVGASSDAAVNGGVGVDVVAGALSFFDDDSTLELALGDGTLIDRAAVPVASDGVALQLSSGMVSQADNDVATSFCHAATTGMFSGKGTPGVTNPACPSGG